MAATFTVINLIFSQKYQALQLTESDPAVAIRLFLLISKTYDWALKILLEILFQNSVISGFQIFIQGFLHAPQPRVVTVGTGLITES